MFSPYMGEEINSIIRRRMELKAGGEVMNIPLVTRLTGAGVSTGTLVGNEEAIDDYGYRIWLEWARNAVTTTKAEQQKDSADIFGEAKPLLSDWISELTRDEIIAALMALPVEAQPAAGVRVNGLSTTSPPPPSAASGSWTTPIACCSAPRLPTASRLRLPPTTGRRWSTSTPPRTSSPRPT